jgi:hypothetical protein
VDYHQLIPTKFDLSTYRFGMPQQSGTLTVLPVFGSNNDSRFVAPLSGLKLSQVRGYGNMELSNPLKRGLRSFLCTWVISKIERKTMPCVVPRLSPPVRN